MHERHAFAFAGAPCFKQGAHLSTMLTFFMIVKTMENSVSVRRRGGAMNRPLCPSTATPPHQSFSAVCHCTVSTLSRPVAQWRVILI